MKGWGGVEGGDLNAKAARRYIVELGTAPWSNHDGTMRKWIVIGMMAIGVVAFFVSQPRRGTVEWHKREYLKAWNAVSQRGTSATKFERWYYEMARSPAPVPARQEEGVLLARKMASNRVALVNLGYLLERRFAVSNRQGYAISKEILKASGMTNDQHVRTLDWMQVYTNVIVVTARPERMHQWEELIRKADVPEDK